MQRAVVGGLLVAILSMMAGISEGIPISIAPAKAEVHKAAQEAAKGMVFQDINIIQLTDVHSWLSGHIHEDGMGADYADCLSFYEHLKTMASEQEKDLWLFDRCAKFLHSLMMTDDCFSLPPCSTLTLVLRGSDGMHPTW